MYRVERMGKQFQIEYTCERCGVSVVRVRSVGVLPRYCAKCADIVRKEKTRARTRAWRERQNEQSSTG